MGQNNRTAAFLRTDKAIIDATVRLLQTKSFDELTVQDILDETPVCRTTFYVHFQDKYQLAEAMLGKFKYLEKEAKAEFNNTPESDYGEIITRRLMNNYDFVQALFKIRTDKVDLMATLAEGFKDEYLSSCKTSDTCHDEAWLYSQIMVTLEIIYLSHTFDGSKLGIAFQDNLLLKVVLHFLKMDGDSETLKFIMNRQAQLKQKKSNSVKEKL